MSCGVRWGDVILLPDNFEGWVTIKYDVPEAAALGRDGRKILIQVPPSGALLTSSDRAIGYGLDEYYFVGSDGHRLRLPTEAEGCVPAEVCVQHFRFYSSPAKVSVFFVGKAGSMARYPYPAE